MSGLPVLDHTELVLPLTPLATALAKAGAAPPPPLPSVGDIRRLRDELAALQRAAVQRDRTTTANFEIVKAWLDANSGGGQGAPGVHDSADSLLPFSPPPVHAAAAAPSASAGLKTVPASVAAKTVPPGFKSPLLESLAKKRKANDDMDADRAGALLYRKTDDGSVKIAISSNGKMKVKIAEPSGMGGAKTIPAAFAASAAAAQALHIQPTASIPIASSQGAYKGAPPPVAPIFAKPKPIGFPKIQKSRHSKKLGSGTGIGKVEVALEETMPRTMMILRQLSEADLAIQRGDYSNAKAPATQIPITTFFGFLDSQYFRPLCDEDIAFLENYGDEITPYIIPRLGKPYHEQWADEDSSLPPSNIHATPSYGAEVNALLGLSAPPPPVAPGSREYEEVGETVYGGDVYIGPLAERLLATLLEEGGEEGLATIDLEAVRRFGEEDGEGDVPSIQTGVYAPAGRRVMLWYLGLFGGEENEADEIDPTEQDEICQELRTLQKDLREQVDENKKRKQILLERASYYRGWEQYNSVLDAISKQIESDYLKRFRQNPNKKKKSSSRPSGGGGVPIGGALSSKHHNIHDQTLDNIKKRRLLIDTIGSLFPYEKVTIPTESIYPTATAAAVSAAVLFHVAAFEIVPGAEDSDGEDDSAEGGSTNNNRHVQQSELHHHHQNHSHHHHHQNGDQQLDNQDSQNNSDENTGKTNATTTTLSNGLLALAAILQRRRGSSATVSSWMEDQSIYDEAEVRSALPCFALMGGDQTETSSLEVLQQPAPRLPPPTHSSQAPLLKSLQQPISVVPPKRVIVIALDSSGFALRGYLEIAVVVLNVRPDVVISSAVLEANGGIAVKIEDDILAKGLALRGELS
ncbi:histone acetyltransferases subunit 3-domain-containing protein [Obelidium mucronatum]|nr:histone acetyltransferases subunit 3-domain-containing protein [Obelidium mucronatum]